ncbi:MAG: response regulator [Pseudobdellovibrio sp.]
MTQLWGMHPGIATIEDMFKLQMPFWSTSFFDDVDIFDDAKDILIVEDDATTSRLFKVMINRFNDTARIKSVGSAEEAKKYLFHLINYNLDGPSVALIDYNLEGENGLAVCDILDQYFPETKIVMVSGLDPQDIRDQIREKHLRVEFVPKPIDQERMTHILND